MQAVGTPRACYICYKATTTVLATANTTDFIYTCDAHLNDPGFATRVQETNDTTETKKAGLSPEEIAKVKEEWEERQKRKQEKAKEKDKGKEEEKKDDEKDVDKEKAKDKDKEEKKTSSLKASPTTSTPSTPATPTPTHQKYTLHRNIFSLRQDEHRRRRQAAQAKELAPRLPGAPTTAIPKP